jgi:alcohol dehydrogenase, propanol-preferring
MKAMLLRHIAPIESAPLELVELPAPEPGPGEVRIRVRCCAICRTDLHVIEGDLPQATMPIIPGHQIVGVIDKLGPEQKGDGRGETREGGRGKGEGGDVATILPPPSAFRLPPSSAHLPPSPLSLPLSASLQLGQRVGVAWLRHTCGYCRYCRAGKENLCESACFTGYHADGGYAEYAVAPADFVYPLPEAFGDVEASPLLCSGIIGYRALRRCNLPAGGTLALYGFGSSAHVVIQIALHRGCQVYVVTRGENHRQLARQMGAVWAGETADEMPVKVDSAILFAPVGTLVPPALEKLNKGGTISLAGIYMTPIPEMDYMRYVFYERDIHSVTSNTRQDGRELLAEASAIPIRPHATIYPLADANRALQDLKNDRISGTGVLMVAE